MMRIKLAGELTEDLLKEALELIGAKGKDVTCYLEGYLVVKAGRAVGSSSGTRTMNASAVILDNEEDDQSENYEEWEGPLPAYVSGVVDNSLEAVERKRTYELERAEYERKHAEARLERERALSEHVADVEIFQRLVLRYGDELICAINKEIAAVWGEEKPVFVHRTKDYPAGASRPMPQLQLLGKTVSFHGFNAAGTTKRILTPLSEKESLSGAGPIWKYPEWRDCAVPRIRAVIDQFSQAAHLVRVNTCIEPD